MYGIPCIGISLWRFVWVLEIIKGWGREGRESVFTGCPAIACAHAKKENLIRNSLSRLQEDTISRAAECAITKKVKETLSLASVALQIKEPGLGVWGDEKVMNMRDLEEIKFQFKTKPMQKQNAMGRRGLAWGEVLVATLHINGKLKMKQEGLYFSKYIFVRALFFWSILLKCSVCDHWNGIAVHPWHSLKRKSMLPWS